MSELSKNQKMAIGTAGIGMLRKLPGVLKRTADSRACIDSKSQTMSRREARRECRDIYGSRLGNAGRKLGILPQEAKGLSVSQFAQKQARANTPNKMGMSTQQEFAFGGGSPTAVKGGFNMWYLIPLVLFIPGIQKLIGIK
jgi:hypothetical protein